MAAASDLFDTAMAIASQPGDFGSRMGIGYSEISRAQAEAGDITGAQATIALMSAEDRGWAYFVIVQAQLTTRDLRAAEATADKIKVGPAQASAYAWIAEAKAKAGDAASAQRLFERAKTIAATALQAWPPDQSGSALSGVAEAQTRAGDRAGALATAAQIPDGWGRALTLDLIAQDALDAGDAATARDLRAQAMAACAQVEDPTRKTNAFTNIVMRRALAFDAAGAKEALATAQATLNHEQFKNSVASEIHYIVAAQAVAGDPKDAIALARDKSNDACIRSQTLSMAVFDIYHYMRK
jgi:hypothetical protein